LISLTKSYYRNVWEVAVKLLEIELIKNLKRQSSIYGVILNKSFDWYQKNQIIHRDAQVPLESTKNTFNVIYARYQSNRCLEDPSGKTFTLIKDYLRKKYIRIPLVLVSNPMN